MTHTEAWKVLEAVLSCGTWTPATMSRALAILLDDDSLRAHGTSSPQPAATSPQTPEGGHLGSSSQETTFQLTTDAEQTHNQASPQRGELNRVV